MRTVGRWRSLLTICVVSDSTTERCSSLSRPRRASARASSPWRISSAWARSDAIAGTTSSEALPVEEGIRLAGDDALGACGLLTAACERLRYDGLEVVHVVEVAALEVVDRRVEVARHGEVDEEERGATAGALNALELGAREDRPRRARAGDDDVCVREALLELVEGRGDGAEALRESLGVLERAVRDARDRRAAPAQVASGALAHLARADDEDPASCELAEDVLRERGRRRRDRCRALRDRRLRPHLLACVERLPEDMVEERARNAGLECVAHLSEDLPLTRDERVEPRGHAEEVERRRLVAQAVEDGDELRLRDARERDERSRGAPLGVVAILRGEVELGAVAGREADRLAALGELQRERSCAGEVEREALPQLDRSGVVRRADEDELRHEKCATGSARRTRTTSANPASAR